MNFNLYMLLLGVSGLMIIALVVFFELKNNRDPISGSRQMKLGGTAALCVLIILITLYQMIFSHS